MGQIETAQRRGLQLKLLFASGEMQGLPVTGVELVGPLPPDLQLTTVFATGVGFDAKEQAAAKEFIKCGAR